MSAQNFIVRYMESCFSGKIPSADCSPVWQISFIALLLILAVGALLVLRVLRVRREPEVPVN